MIEYVTRFLNMLVAGLLAHAARLAKLAAAKHEITEFAAALDEADALENSGVPTKQKLAKLLRLEVEQTIETAFTAPASPTQPASMNGDGLIGGGGGDHHPFALSGPTEASANSAEGRVTRRRGRRPSAAKLAEEQAPEDPTVTPPAENPDTQPSPGGEDPWPGDA